MTQWNLHIVYDSKPYVLKAVLEYQSNQIMRIRVDGTKRSLLLENNYPMLLSLKSKKGIQWKIREGSLDNGSEKNSNLLFDIIKQLEYFIKHEVH